MSSCSPCQKLLEKVLISDDSRPSKILQALGATKIIREDGSLSIELPSASTLARRWTRLVHDKGPTEPTLQATSSQVDWIQVECKTCSDWGPEGSARAFVMGPQPLSIVVCQNRLSNDTEKQKHEMQELLVHELLHVYDVRKLALDLKDCESLAYSEVRAAREAECYQGNYSWMSSRHCVRNKATTATSNLFPYGKAKSCVNRVMERAYQDKRPFQEEET